MEEGPWKVGLVKEGRWWGGGAAEAGPSDLSSDNILDGGTDLLLKAVPLLPFLRIFIFFEDFNLPPTHPSGVDTHAPIFFSSLSFKDQKGSIFNKIRIKHRGGGGRGKGDQEKWKKKKKRTTKSSWVKRGDLLQGQVVVPLPRGRKREAQKSKLQLIASNLQTHLFCFYLLILWEIMPKISFSFLKKQ